ncbi:MAG: hypothetical protein KOO60_08625 [Gemmatimonadales bacterium]|nr:hypothetical protein [Gemmatimonadales bacterium]
MRSTANKVLLIVLLSLSLGLLLSGCTTAPGPSLKEAVFYPSPPTSPRLQYLTHYSGAEQVTIQPGTASRFLFGDSAPTEALSKPYGMALHGGKLYVCDTKLNSLVIFDIAQHRFGYTGLQGSERLRKPLNLCVDNQGNKFVADALRGEIVVFDENDAWTTVFGGNLLQRPVDVAWLDGKLYVCDADACTIVVFDATTHERVTVFGGKGDDPGQFARPTNLALDPEGNIYVSDTINGRIQKLGPDGNHVATFGSRGDRPGTFARPKGVAVDPEGQLYVVDAAFENVQIFAPAGRMLMDFGGPGADPGNLVLPAQVIIDTDHLSLFRELIEPGFKAEHLVLVSSQYGPRKISVYAYGRSEGSGH